MYQELTDRLTSGVARCVTEEEVRFLWLSELKSALGVQFQAERERNDAYYNGVVIEFKNAGLFGGKTSSPAFKEAVYDRLDKYIKRRSESEGEDSADYIGIATDGRHVAFITAQELEDLYPDLTPKQRENTFAKKHGTVFIQGIGGKLRSGKPHDGRAPDYDDWEMNGDILFYDPILDCALEISSMGIRVSPESLDRQLTLAGCDERRKLPFHKMLLEGQLPLTMGGGIGQSRLCMLLLGKAHIGEVQSSIWDEHTRKVFEDAHITLL